MKTKRFHIGAVLTAITGTMVSARNFDECRDLIDFMCDEKSFGHQQIRFMAECKPYLLGWFPQLDSPEMQCAWDKLDAMLERITDGEERRLLILGWLVKITSGQYGIKDLPLCGESHDLLEIEQLPLGEHERIDPQSELLEMRHPDSIVTVQT